MMTAATPHNTVSSYWNFVKHLSPDAKRDLIALLSQSLKSSTVQTISAKKYYGMWGDDGMTDEDFINELKSMRNFRHEGPRDRYMFRNK